MATILVVEDIMAVRISLQVVLESDGHTVTAVADGNQGLALLNGTSSFDLVITDIWMPGSSGSDVIREGRLRSPRTRFLAITGGDPGSFTPHDAAHQENFGADEILLKPFEREALLAAVSRLAPAASR